jgi:hypothetical protein
MKYRIQSKAQSVWFAFGRHSFRSRPVAGYPKIFHCVSRMFLNKATTVSQINFTAHTVLLNKLWKKLKLSQIIDLLASAMVFLL